MNADGRVEYGLADCAVELAGCLADMVMDAGPEAAWKCYAAYSTCKSEWDQVKQDALATWEDGKEVARRCERIYQRVKKRFTVKKKSWADSDEEEEEEEEVEEEVE
jgi:hypothetical protein